MVKQKYSLSEIEAEYNLAAKHNCEFKKVKWASHEKMINRFYLAMKELSFNISSSWLDVGCGTGAFQALVGTNFPHIRSLAIDISQELINFVKTRKDMMGVEFMLIDFMSLKDRQFDLITSIGVLQKTTFSVKEFFQQTYNLLAPGGRVFVDTKHINWKMFHKPNFSPEPSHQWFNLDKLIKSAQRSGLEVDRYGGFLPEEGKVVPPEDSHTIFLIARKRGIS